MRGMHNCAVAAAAIIDRSNYKKQDLPKILIDLLYAQENRGELSAGIATNNYEEGFVGEPFKKLGTAKQVFHSGIRKNLFEEYAGTRGIGHIRYATSGCNSDEYAQPMYTAGVKKEDRVGVSFNGNLSNYLDLVDILNSDEVANGKDFTVDTQILLHYIYKGLRTNGKCIVDSLAELSNIVIGAYNLAILDKDKVSIARDPFGFRPLSYGVSNGLFVAASESSAIRDIVGEKNIVHVQPGHVVIVRDNEIKVEKFADSKTISRCMFEFVYFSKVDSVFDLQSVYAARYFLGQELALEEKTRTSIPGESIVVDVPLTGQPYADAFAYSLGLRRQQALIRKNEKRTFIHHEDKAEAVRNKFSVLSNVLDGSMFDIQGLPVFVIDDSNVRGNTAARIVKLLKDNGAEQVHYRFGCPPIRYPCYYGIDMASVSELVASRHINPRENLYVPEFSKEFEQSIAKEIGADTVGYLSYNGLINSLTKNAKFDGTGLCTACLTGKYPTPDNSTLVEKALRHFEQGSNGRDYEMK